MLKSSDESILGMGDVVIVVDLFSIQFATVLLDQANAQIVSAA